MSLPGRLLSHIQFSKNSIFDRTTPLIKDRVYVSNLRAIYCHLKKSQCVSLCEYVVLVSVIYLCLSGSQITDAGSEKFKLPDDGNRFNSRINGKICLNSRFYGTDLRISRITERS